MKERMDKIVEYFNGDELAANVWQSKYAHEGEETPDDMHKRLAKEFAKVEKEYQEDENSIGDAFERREAELFLSKYGENRKKLTEETIYKLFKDFKYVIPQGSIMSQLGAKNIGSLSNCFVIGQPEDSYGGIFQKDEELVQLMKRRGGVGIDISTLRPEGTTTTNAAKTSTGAISFMHRFSNSTREVAQNGRRGALMMSMDINHPDIMEFIKIKRDLTQITGANISIKLNDEFMKAVEKDEDYILRFPCDTKIPEEDWDIIFPSYGKIETMMSGDVRHKDFEVHFKRIRAREYWDEIIKSAHGVAEPGLMYWNRMIEYSPDGVYPEYQAITTNPCCFAKNSRVDVITQKGIKDIKCITKNDKVWLENENKFVKTTGYFDTGKQETFKVIFSNGVTYNITGNHKLPKVILKRIGNKTNKESFKLIELKDLKVGDEIRVQTSVSKSFGTKGNYKEGLLFGWLSGDGHLSFNSATSDYPSFSLDFWKKEHDIVPMYQKIIKDIGFDLKIQSFKNNDNDVLRLKSSRLTRYFTEKYEFNIWKFRKGNIPFLYKANEEFIKGYLSAYFTADGTIGNDPKNSRFSISLSSIDRDRLDQVQVLLSNFGIKSSIGLMKKAGTSKDYAYRNSKDCYRLTIPGILNIRLFSKYINFQNNNKKELLKTIVERDFQFQKSTTYTKIVSIESNGINETGCITVPEYHYFSANGVITGNSEIAMQPYDACRLIAVNLFSFVDNSFTKEATFNKQKFYEVNYEAMRLSDNLIDLEINHIQRILDKIDSDPESDEIKLREKELWTKVLETATASRRTGLGFTALGDTLAALGIKYGTEESLEVIQDIMHTKMESELDCTTDLAVLRGTFEGWDSNKEFNGKYSNDFYKFIMNKFPDKALKMAKYGRRNVSWSTVAPTGSLSMLAQVSSGIEPMFMPFYMRRKKVNPGEGVRVDFTDQNGDTWQEFPVLHEKFKDWLIINNTLTGYSEAILEKTLDEDWLKDCFQDSPWYGATANDIPWNMRVKTQALIQKYISHSISSTVNLPEDVSLEEVSNIYMEAWKQGIKGITVYRDGSRSGVLVDTSKKETTQFEYKDAVKRPKSLVCDIHTTSSKGIKYNVIVGMLDRKPYEVFVIPHFTNETNMQLVKIKRSRYDLIDGCHTYSEDITTEMSDEQEAITRLISTSLRHGADIKFLVEQLNKTTGSLFGFTGSLARILKKYIPEGAKSTVTCEACGSDNVIFEEGCSRCLDCGSSKCG